MAGMAGQGPHSPQWGRRGDGGANPGSRAMLRVPVSPDPVFVGSAYLRESLPAGNPEGDDDKVYFFFSETGKEFDYFENTIVSRIARVCKVGTGVGGLCPGCHSPLGWGGCGPTLHVYIPRFLDTPAPVGDPSGAVTALKHPPQGCGSSLLLLPAPLVAATLPHLLYPLAEGTQALSSSQVVFPWAPQTLLGLCLPNTGAAPLGPWHCCMDGQSPALLAQPHGAPHCWVAIASCPDPLCHAGGPGRGARAAAAMDDLPEGTAALLAPRGRLPLQRAAGRLCAHARGAALEGDAILWSLHLTVVSGRWGTQESTLWCHGVVMEVRVSSGHAQVPGVVRGTRRSRGA